MKKFAALFVLALALAVGVIGLSIYEEMRKSASADPLVWQADIARFEAADAAAPPPADATVVVGDSHVRLWHTLAQDLAPLTTVQRGFGGARVNDLVYYAATIIQRYAPAQVVIVSGANDVNNSSVPLQAVPEIGAGLERLLQGILAARADTRIVYLAIPPSIAYWDKWDATQAANNAAERACAAFPGVTFMPTADLFLDAQGQPLKQLYQYDGMHLSREGYQRLVQRLKPLLL